MLVTSEGDVGNPTISYEEGNPFTTLHLMDTSETLNVYYVYCNWMPLVGDSFLGIRTLEDGKVKAYISLGYSVNKQLAFPGEIDTDLLKCMEVDYPKREIIWTPPLDIGSEGDESCGDMIQFWVEVPNYINMEAIH